MRSRHVAPAGVVIVVCGVLLVALTGAVALKLPDAGEMELVRAAVSLRSDAITGVVWLLTFISSSAPALLICAALSVVEWLRLRTSARPIALSTFAQAAWPLVAYLGALACNVALRIAVGRMRPEVDYIAHLLPEVQADFQRFSYPSGHAGAALIAYVSLVIVLRRSRFIRWIGIAAAALLIAGVGFGRVYLGVHWPSDVLAGYLLGAAWLVGARCLCHRLIFSRVARTWIQT